MDNNDFYLVGEVYNYGVSGGKLFDYGDKKVNYYDDMFTEQINFEFKWNAKELDNQELFKKYSDILNGELNGFGVLNYLSSHDDGSPFDPSREKPFETANKLLLSPGTSQVYYGDESARSLVIEGTQGDATLRSFMNWDAINSDEETKAVLAHWQKLGKFRERHPAIGAGKHQMITQKPYLFYRSYQKGDFKDLVVVGLDLPKGKKVIDVSKIFEERVILQDAYSGQKATVENGKITIDSEYNIVLIEKQ